MMKLDQREETPAAEIPGQSETAGDIQYATEGSGPLLQRDYVIAMRDCQLTPEEIMRQLRADFPRFSPEELARFWREDHPERPLALNDVMGIHIKASGDTQVQITHMDARSLTMHTIEGHPEAGRITFGATRDPGGDVVFRIRSRARAADPVRLVGYGAIGMAMQTEVWLTFCRRVAELCGAEIHGDVVTSTVEVEEAPEDRDLQAAPTFAAE